MKPLAMIVALTLACLFSAGLPVRCQPVQGLPSELISKNISIKTDLQPYRYVPSNVYEESVTSGSFSYLETDRRRTRGGNMVRGLGIGLGIGAAGGGLIGALSYTPCNEDGFMDCFMHPESRGDAILLGAVIGGGLGGIFGILIGTASKTGNRVKPPVNVRLDMTPIPTEQLSYSPSVTVNLQLKSKR